MRAKVGLVARGVEGLEGARREIEAAGGEALVLPADVADEEQVEHVAAEVERTLGRLDVWVNCAMCSVFAPTKEMTPLDYERVTSVTYLGVVYGTLAALRRMLPADHGVIVPVGSALARRSIPLQSAYCAAKHAVVGFTESLRCELLHDRSRVRVTTVQLPALNTPQFSWVKTRMPRAPRPVPPVYQPEVAARAIVHAALHPRRKEMYVGLPTVEAIVADKVFSSAIDRYLAVKGYDAQQTDEPVREPRLDNLWLPLPGDRGARGSFSPHARDGSAQLWMNTHRPLLAVLGAVALGVALLIARR
jgi:NAD(P)-dependent dehydrogenase (short-subunit alcohol dehydrogenase family)